MRIHMPSIFYAMFYKLLGVLLKVRKSQKQFTGIPRFTLLMWGHIKKPAESKNRVNRGYLVVLKGWKIG